MDDVTLCLAASAAYYVTPTFSAACDINIVLTTVDNTIIVAFRGTEPTSLDDWLRDFDALPIDTLKIGICHEGFLTGAEAVLDFLLAQLRGKQFVVTGHSLGGALAIAATALLVVNGVIPLKLTTFGAPNVGIADTLEKILAPVEGSRYRNGNDPVPLVPFWPFVSDRPQVQIGEPLLDPIADHMLDKYLVSLEDLK